MDASLLVSLHLSVCMRVMVENSVVWKLLETAKQRQISRVLLLVKTRDLRVGKNASRTQTDTRLQYLFCRRAVGVKLTDMNGVIFNLVKRMRGGQAITI